MSILNVHAEYLIFPRPISPPPSSLLNPRALGGQSHWAPIGEQAQRPAKNLGNDITSLCRVMKHRVTLGSCPRGLESSPVPRWT